MAKPLKPVTSDDWQVEEDARILIRAAEIKLDAQRIKAAYAKVEEMAKAANTGMKEARRALNRKKPRQSKKTKSNPRKVNSASPRGKKRKISGKAKK